jgi:L-asparagine oxygenase
VVNLPFEPFTFGSQDEGRLIQHVVPDPSHETGQTSEGGAELAWRVKDAFRDDRCDYVGLLCLRGQPGAATMLAPARTLNLPINVAQALRQDRFVIAPDRAHGVDPLGAPSSPGPVLTGPDEDPEICFDTVLHRPADPGDGEAAEALEVLAASIHRTSIGHVLRPGEVLILDNRRVVQGPPVFEPRYDGAGRWLERVMLCADRRAHRRRGGNRILV